MSPQSNRQGRFSVAVTPRAALVKVDGLATLNSCAPLQSFLAEVRSSDVSEVIFDLSDCRGFDSTFMGTLVSIVSPGGEGETGARVVLVNASPEQRELLGSVGVDRIIDVCREPVPAPPVRLRPLEDARAVDPDTHLRKVVRAHEHLVELDPKNEERFGAFLALVRRELSRG